MRLSFNQEVVDCPVIVVVRSFISSGASASAKKSGSQSTPQLADEANKNVLWLNVARTAKIRRA